MLDYWTKRSNRVYCFFLKMHFLDLCYNSGANQ